MSPAARSETDRDADHADAAELAGDEAAADDEQWDDESDAWQPLMTPRERWVKGTLLLLVGAAGGTLYWWWRHAMDGSISGTDVRALVAGYVGWLICCVIAICVIRKGNREDRERLAEQAARRSRVRRE